jgi:sugar phosphate isomerase/epimerase
VDLGGLVLSLACQEQLLPGADLESKWDFACSVGYDAIELRGQGELAVERRLPELRRAVAAGVVLRTVCVDMPHFIGSPDAGLRADAVAQLRSQLSVVGELGGVGVVTPASCGTRDEAVGRPALLAALAELGEHAVAAGVTLFLEPLNRYEDHLVNRLEQAASLVDEVGLPSVRVGAGTFHMNIEEDDPVAALVLFGSHVGHVHVSDSNRLQPGAGHVDWPRLLRALVAIGYVGDVVLESGLRGEPTGAVASVPAFLRAQA